MAVMRGAVGRGDDPPGERRVGHDDLGDLARGHVLALDEAHQVQRHALGRCLLYTSPNPRDRTRYRMPSSA